MAKRNRDAQQKIFKMLEAAHKQGFRIDPPLKNGRAKGQDRHYMVFGKDGKSIVTVSSSPSDPRTPMYVRQQLRRMGVVVK